MKYAEVKEQINKELEEDTANLERIEIKIWKMREYLKDEKEKTDNFGMTVERSKQF